MTLWQPACFSYPVCQKKIYIFLYNLFSFNMNTLLFVYHSTSIRFIQLSVRLHIFPPVIHTTCSTTDPPPTGLEIEMKWNSFWYLWFPEDAVKLKHVLRMFSFIAYKQWNVNFYVYKAAGSLSFNLTQSRVNIKCRLQRNIRRKILYMRCMELHQEGVKYTEVQTLRAQQLCAGVPTNQQGCSQRLSVLKMRHDGSQCFAPAPHEPDMYCEKDHFHISYFDKCFSLCVSDFL